MSGIREQQPTPPSRLRKEGDGWRGMSLEGLESQGKENLDFILQPPQELLSNNYSILVNLVNSSESDVNSGAGEEERGSQRPT